jgi:serine/threonine protein kinase/tetratricopeptide (TPR) repeat protein
MPDTPDQSPSAAAASNCPTEAELKRLRTGALADAECDRLLDHLKMCPVCAASSPPVHGRLKDTIATAKPTGEFDAATVAAPVRDDAGGSGGETHRPASQAVFVEGYHVTREIGRGGMGVIYEAVQSKLNRKVALKILPAGVGAANDQAVARFRREATAAAGLHHTHIVPIYDFGQSGHTYYYAMELIEGQPLTELIHRFADVHAPTLSPTALADLISGVSGGDGLPAPAPGAADSSSSQSGMGSQASGRVRLYFRHVARWMADAAEALHYAHAQGIIHRDIKPGNLMVARGGRIMILDFGLAKSTSEISVTTTGSLLGTLRYMSPEQAMAKRMKVDHRTDIYSLGATMYELLALQPAFRGADEKETLGLIITRDPTPPRKLVPQVPRELETICLKTLEKNPGARYATARELAEDLHRFMEDRPIVARPTGPLGRAVKFIRRRRAMSVATLCVVLLAGAVAMAARSAQRARESDRRSREIRVTALLKAGADHFNRREWDAAETAYFEALRIEPRSFDALVNLAGVKQRRFSESGAVEALHEASQLLDRALQVDPLRVQTWNVRGVTLRSLGRLDEAVAAHRRGIEVDPAYYANWVSLASAHVLKDDLPQAEQCLTRATSLCKPADGTMPWHNLAAVRLQLNRPDALAAIEQALSIRTDEVHNSLLLARILLRSGPAADPKKALRAAITADGLGGPKHRNPRVARILALAELRNEHWADAIAWSKKAIEFRDSPAWAHLVMAVAEGRLGNAGAARGHIDAATAARPANFSPGGLRVQIEYGLLWIEDSAELDQLQVEAEARLRAAQGGGLGQQGG